MKKNYIAFLLLLLLNQRITAQCSPIPYTVPYLETFSSLTANDQLPPCWVASNMGATCHTYLANQCAGFYDYPTGNSSFYSPAIHLNAGTVYSASITYSTSSYSSSGSSWAQLALLLSPYANSANNVMLANVISASATVSTVLSNTFTVNSSGSYELIIRVTSTTGLISNLYFDNVSITAPCSLNPVSMAVLGHTMACIGESTTLTASGATSYTWTNGQTLAYTPNVVVSPTTSTTYTVLGQTNQCSNTATFTLSVNPNSIPTLSITSTNSVICSGETATLSANGAGTYTWSWQNGFATQQGLQIVVSPAASTTYTIVGDTAGCMNSTAFVENVDACTGLQVEKIRETSIYPNPGNGLFTIATNTAYEKTITVFDLLGKQVYSNAPTHDEKINIDLEDFSSGIYYVKIKSPEESVVIKIIKQ